MRHKKIHDKQFIPKKNTGKLIKLVLMGNSANLLN